MIDRHVILTVVILIGLALLLLIGGILYGSMRGAQLDAGVTALAGTALGYLGGLLTNVARKLEAPAAPIENPPLPVA